MDLALNNLQRLICHKTQPTNQIKIWFCFFVLWHINLHRLFNVEYILVEDKLWY